MLAPYQHNRPAPAAIGTYTSPLGLTTVLTPELNLPDGRAYDQFVATGPGAHYTQSRAWAPVVTAGKPFQPLYFLARRAGVPVGAALLLRTRLGGLALPVAQTERGPVADPADLADVLVALRRACRARGIWRLAVMPYDTDRTRIEKILHDQGFEHSQRPAGRHVRSLRIDLTAIDPANPFAGSAFAKPRHEVSRSLRAGVTARLGRREDLAAFRALEEATAAKQGRTPPPADWYGPLGDYFLGGSRGAMFVSEAGGEMISAMFVTLHDGLATYIVGATTARALKFPKTALAMAEAIGWARRAGAHTFDLGGIPMAGDTDPKRAAIAEFKFSYTRTTVELVHEHVRWF